jgi:DNA-binding NarL/FixJ family response regulator
LTPREHEALVLLARGKTNKEIAKAMNLSAETVKKMVQSIIAKLGASDRTHAAVKALRAGLI